MKKIILAALSLAYVGMIQAQIYMSENFTGGVPATWTQSTLANDGGWIAGTAASLSSASFGYPEHGNFLGSNDDGCNCNKIADSLITEVVDLTAAASPVFLHFDMFYLEGTYQSITESFNVYVQAQTTGVWSLVYDAPVATVAQWENDLSFDLSSYIGDQVKIAFVYSDGGGWLFGVGIDNVKLFTPFDFDASNVSIDNSPFHEVNTSNTIEGTVKNVGSQAITSLTIEYSIDGGAPASAALTGLNIAPGASYSYSHTVPWTPTMTQTYEVETTVTLVNGYADQDMTNNDASMSILVHPPAVARTPLLEAFTSSTCGPCNPGNVNVNNVLSNFQGEYSKVNYQMSWPGTGDPYYTDEGGDRRTYYDVNSVPNIFTDGANGINSNNYTANDFTSAQMQPAFISMETDATVHNEVVYEVVNGQLEVVESKWVLNASSWFTPLINLPSNLVAHHAINEKLTFENIKSNGETEFEHVMKKMMPSAAGQSLSAVSANDTVMLSNTHEFVGDYRLSNDALDPINHSIEHSIEEFSDLEIVFWIQTPATGEIWQSYHQDVVVGDEVSNLTTLEENGETIYVIDNDTFELFGGVVVPLGIKDNNEPTFKVYPNPAKDLVYIAGTEGMANVTMFDVQGRVVKLVSTQSNTIQVSDLPTGMYIVRIENNDIVKNVRVSVAK